jgi:hypothetical protein
MNIPTFPDTNVGMFLDGTQPGTSGSKPPILTRRLEACTFADSSRALPSPFQRLLVTGAQFLRNFAQRLRFEVKACRK